MSDLIARARAWKQANPDFPLTVHVTGRFVKMVLGKLVYFGSITEDVDSSARAAWNKWTDEKDYLLNGRKPPQRAGEGVVTVKELIDRFLDAKLKLVELGERSQRTFTDYLLTGKRIADSLGRKRAVDDLDSDDFDRLLASFKKTLGPVSTSNMIQRVRTIFKWGLSKKLLTKPADFGPDFVKPSQKVMRKARRESGIKMFEPEEIRKLLAAAGPQMKCMILLGANAAFGNHDVASLPISAVDLDKGWVSYPRPKTEIDRRCPLWDETKAAIKTVLAKRREPKDPAHAGLLFVTKPGGSWAKNTCDNPVTKEFAKLLQATGLTQKGRNFYALRHTFLTVADATRDFPAVAMIMGHSDASMAARYRERISDERLQAVSTYVRSWLFPKASKVAKPKKAAPKRAAKPKPVKVRPVLKLAHAG